MQCLLVITGVALCCALAQAEPSPSTSPSTSTNPTLTVRETGSGSPADFEVLLDGEAFLASSPTRVHCDGTWYSTSAELGTQRLQLQSLRNTTSVDSWGAYFATTATYNCSGTAGFAFETEIRVYTTGDRVSFLQTYLSGCMNASLGRLEDASSQFPSFSTKAAAAGNMSFAVFFGGNQLQAMQGGGGLGRLCGPARCGSHGAFPALLSSAARIGAQTPAVALSPAARFKETVSVMSDQGDYIWGTLGTLETLPPGYASEVVMLSGPGPRGALTNWGRALRHRYQREPHDACSRPTTRDIMYATDNGAWAYYNAGPYSTMTGLMQAVSGNATQLGLQFGSVLLDSFTYPKSSRTQGPNCNPNVPLDQGLDTWTGCPNLFPDGLSDLQRNVLHGTPLMVHSRWVSPVSPYTKQFEMLVSREAALPVDAYAFFSFLIGERKTEWGLTLYEQDWTGKWLESGSTSTRTCRRWLAPRTPSSRAWARPPPTTAWLWPTAPLPRRPTRSWPLRFRRSSSPLRRPTRTSRKPLTPTGASPRRGRSWRPRGRCR